MTQRTREEMLKDIKESQKSWSRVHQEEIYQYALIETLLDIRDTLQELKNNK